MKTMKTLKNVMIAVVLMFGVQALTASNVKIKTNGNTSVVIEVTKNSVDENIKIFDNEGHVLFYETIKNESYLKVFKMDNLPSGKYFVQYENESKVNTAVVEKTIDGELITSDILKISFKPIVKQNGNVLSVGFTNPKLNAVEISIQDLDGYEVVELDNLNELLIRKNFNTKKLPQGEYTINVRSGKDSFTQIIDIK